MSVYVCAGVRASGTADAVLYRVPSAEPAVAVADLPAASADQLLEADAIVLGAPAAETLTGPARAFLDTAAAAWSTSALAGKTGAAFAVSEREASAAAAAVVSTLHAALLHSGAAVVAGAEQADTGAVLFVAKGLRADCCLYVLCCVVFRSCILQGLRAVCRREHLVPPWRDCPTPGARQIKEIYPAVGMSHTGALFRFAVCGDWTVLLLCPKVTVFALFRLYRDLVVSYGVCVSVPCVLCACV